jgi:glucose-1-phosphate thymidylyltransferase
MIDHVVGKVDEVEQVNRIYVVVNDRFFRDFREWAKTARTSKPLSLLNDGSTSNDDRLGAIADMHFAVEKGGIGDDLLVVGGDNLFDFDLTEFVSFFRERGTSVGLHACDDSEIIRRTSTVEIDEKARLISFEEKPAEHRSNLVAICLYLFEKASLRFLGNYLENGGNPDAPGHYIQWLHKQIPVYGKVLTGSWCDIGDEKTYREADKLYTTPGEKSDRRKTGSRSG